MSLYVPDINKNCCFCYHAQRDSKNDIVVDDTKELYCPVKKCHIVYTNTVECGTDCEDNETNQDWLNIDKALRIGREYQRTGNIRVFL